MLAWSVPTLLAVLGLYAATLAREITFGDAGEIATAVARLGVIHPTGYPLYTLVGHAAVRLLPVPPHLALAWLNVGFALGALLFCAGCVRVLAAGRSSPSRTPAAIAGGLFGGVVLATSPVMWAQVRTVELYALHVLVVSAALFFLARFEVRRRPGDLAGVGVTLALGAAHHATTVLLAACALGLLLVRSPRFLIAWWPGRGTPAERRALLLIAIASGLALASYALLPVAARHTDALAWGDPTSLPRLLDHATAELYRQFAPPESAVLFSRAGRIPGWLATQVALPWLALALWGAVLLLRSAPGWGVCAAGYAALSFGQGLGYRVDDYETYFLPAVAVVSVFVGRGAVELLLRCPARPRPGVAIAALALLLAHALTRVDAVRATARSAEPYIGAVLATLPPGSIYLTARDAYTFPLWYARHVQGRGRDVAVVNAFMLGQPWYADYLAAGSPRIDLDAARAPARARPGPPSRYPPEIRAHRLLAANLPERRVFERNLFSYRYEGILGRRWDGPAFDRPSAGWVLLNRGVVNEIVPFSALEGVDPCGRDRLRRIATRGPEGSPTDPATAYRPSPHPRLLETSGLGSDGDAPYLELAWLERWSFDPSRPGRRGDPIRHGVRVCVFDGLGRRVHSAELTSGDAARSRVKLPADLSGRRVTVQACSVGALRERGLGERPCLYPILELDTLVP